MRRLSWLIFLATLQLGAAPVPTDPTCYQDSAKPVAARQIVVWCPAEQGQKEFFQMLLGATPNQCKPVSCRHQLIPPGSAPKPQGYVDAPLKVCRAALTRPGCYQG